MRHLGSREWEDISSKEVAKQLHSYHASARSKIYRGKAKCAELELFGEWDVSFGGVAPAGRSTATRGIHSEMSLKKSFSPDLPLDRPFSLFHSHANVENRLDEPFH